MVITPSRKKALRVRRHARIRSRVAGTKARPRLSVFRSKRHMFAQLIDDVEQRTLVSVSDKEVKAKNGIDIAAAVGELVAKRAKEAGVTKAIFDRGGFSYHGRVAAVANGARKGGLKF